MTDPKKISIQEFSYPLPDERIAFFPKAERDQSKLLVYKEGKITDDIYKNISQYIPENSLLVFNDTKVIKARLQFKKDTGGTIEVFCLEPDEAINEYSTVMNRKEKVRWKCMIGGAGKWKEGALQKMLNDDGTQLSTTLITKLPDAYLVEFSWTPAHLTFAEVIDQAGDIPLPPYIKRHTEATDLDRYQTIYAKDEGSVAAPTAGLHFTETVFNDLAEKNIQKAYVTLHVGAGTFKPVKAALMLDHEMHSEWISVDIAFIKMLLEKINDPCVAVGTTSTRTLESLYWLGVKAYMDPDSKMLELAQWDVYEEPLSNNMIAAEKALTALTAWLIKNKRDHLFTQTQILIAPGYRFKIVDAIVTNFHQPQSTLLLLVCAAIGKNWRRIYEHALANDYRFLSYGDGSLLFIDKDKAEK